MLLSNISRELFEKFKEEHDKEKMRGLFPQGSGRV